MVEINNFLYRNWLEDGSVAIVGSGQYVNYMDSVELSHYPDEDLEYKVTIVFKGNQFFNVFSNKIEKSRSLYEKLKSLLPDERKTITTIDLDKYR